MPALFRTLLLVALEFLAMRVFAADELFTVYRQVLMPDERPAVGARVVIRTLNSDNSLCQEVVAVTDRDGMLEAKIRFAEKTKEHCPFLDVAKGYLIAQAPGCALAVGKLLGAAPPPFGARLSPPTPGMPNNVALRLTPAYQLYGNVFDGETAKPVAGATVFPVRLGFCPLNYFWAGIVTRELMTVSDANGKFSLPGITEEALDIAGHVYNEETAQAAVVAYATVNDRTFAYQNDVVNFTPQARRPLPIPVDPAPSLEGKVVNSLTNQPMAGVQVHLRSMSDWVNCLPAVVTDDNGVYVFPTVLPGSRIYAETKMADYTEGWVLATEGEDDAEKLTAPDIAIRPMSLPTTFQVVDKETGQQPISPMELNVLIDSGILAEDLGMLGRTEIVVPMDANGAAAVSLPQGDNQVTVTGPGYGAMQTVTVPAEGAVKIEVERREGLFIRFIIQDFNTLGPCQVAVHDGAGNDVKLDSSPLIANKYAGYWFSVLEGAPQGPFQVQVTRYFPKETLTGWTNVNPNTWPNVIPLQ